MIELFNKELELDKLRKDLKYYFENCVIRELKYPTRVQPKYYGVKPTEAQLEILDDIQHNSFILINQARMVGITTLMRGYALYLTQLFPNKKVLLGDTTVVQAIQNLDHIMKLYSLAPNYSTVPIQSYKQMQVVFENGSSIQCYNPGSTTYQKEKYDLIYVDNASFIKDLSKYLNTLHNTVADTGCLVCGSTIYREGEFRDMCYLAERDGEVPFHYKKVTHLQSKKRTRAYVNKMMQVKDEEEVKLTEYAIYYRDKNMQLRHLLEDFNEVIEYKGPKTIKR